MLLAYRKGIRTMSGKNERHRLGWAPRVAVPLWLGAAIASMAPAKALAQQVIPLNGDPAAATAPFVAAPPAPSFVPPAGSAPGSAVVGAPVAGAPVVLENPDQGIPAEAGPAIPVLDPNIQVVRFSGPEGLNAELMAPVPETIAVAPTINPGLATVGLRMGTGYRLRLTNIPNRPTAELYPVVEVVGHLHRPDKVDPARYPIRVSFDIQDLHDVVDNGRLVTKVIYLEDQDQALPLKLPKDEIPTVTINPTEEPLKVAASLGRVVAIVRIGGRRPAPEEMDPNIFDAPLWTLSLIHI